MYIVEEKNKDGSNSVSYFYDDYEGCKRYFMHRVFVYLSQNQEVFSYGAQFTISAFFEYLLDCNLSNKNAEAACEKYHSIAKKLFIFLASYEENKNIELDKMEFEEQNAEGLERVKLDINDVEFNIDYWDVSSHHFIHTNINDNSKTEYYFISNQEVICCEPNSKYELGEKYNIDIRIRYIESFDDSIC